MIPPRTTKPITHHVPEHLYEAFLQNATEFLENAHTGSTAAQRAIEARLRDRDAGLDSLAYLLRITLGSSGQCGIVARFLAGLYNGTDFPFDLTELRGLDADLFEHCIALLRLDNAQTVEIHNYIPDGEHVFLKLLQDWNMVKRPAPPPPAADWYNVRYDSYGNAPGYRDYSMFVRLALKDGQPGQSERIELNFNAEDSAQILQDVLGIHKFVWDDSSRKAPIDCQPGEHRPDWLPE